MAIEVRETTEPFRGLLLRYRGRTGLSQRQFAECIGVHRRSLQQWETGVNYPGGQRLEAIIRVLLEANGLTPGREAAEAQELWTAVEHEARRLHGRFDTAWFARLQTEPPTVTGATEPAPASILLGPASTPGERPGAGPYDWGEAPDTKSFVGRAGELTLMRRWVLNEQRRLVAALGMGGIGKTILAARLAQDVAPSFERVYWRSLRDAPPVNEWLAGAISFLSDQQLAPPSIESERFAALLQLLRARRCLLVLDNFEALFEPGQSEGAYRVGMEGYRQLLTTVGDAPHESCLVLTSRERPPELALLGGAAGTLELSGLGVGEAKMLLSPKQLDGTAQDWAALNNRFGGNGLALKVVGESIRELFGGEIGSFLGVDTTAASSVFGGIRRVLAEQVDRSSPLEQQILRLLAIDREPLSIGNLVAELGPAVGAGTVLQAVEALRRRSLVERGQTTAAAGFTLQSVVLEFMTNRLVETVVEEIDRSQPVLIRTQPLIKALSKDYVRQTQERLIGWPILQRLNAKYDQTGTEQRLLTLLGGWRGLPTADQAYGPGNVVNLLRVLRGDLRDLNLSRLSIRQAYLAEVDAQGASLMDTHLAETALAEAFEFPGSVALTDDGALLAVGTSSGHVWLWRAADRTLLWVVHGHTGAVWRVAVSAEGQLVASGGTDGTVRLWETATGRPLASLQGHRGGIWGVALSANGQLVASSGDDGTVRLWDSRTARQLAILQGHSGTVWRVALSANGQVLASGGTDATVRLWDTTSGHQLATLRGHSSAVYGVALSADGQVLASGGHDATVRLWDATSGRQLAILDRHTATVYNVALSADGQTVASSGANGQARLWEAASTGTPRAMLLGHAGGVWGVALSGDGQLVVSAGTEGTVRLWEAASGQPLATLQGHTGGVWGLALSADGHLLASGGTEGTVRLWENGTGRQVRTLRGHTGVVYGVAMSVNGQLVASSGDDGTVRLWENGTGRQLRTLRGHTGAVYGVALSADGQLLASGGADGTVRLWDAALARPAAVGPTAEQPQPSEHSTAAPPSDWRPVATFRGHTGGVYSVALSIDRQRVAGGGDDGSVRVWEVDTGRAAAILEGHAGAVWGLAFSADGQLLASGDTEGFVRLWEIPSEADSDQHSEVASSDAVASWRAMRPLASFHDQSGGVWSVAMSRTGKLLASGGGDGSVRLWDTALARSGAVSPTAERAQPSEHSPAAPPSEGQGLATLHGHAGTVWGLAFSADGQLLASGSFDGTVKLWEVSSGACLRTLRSERRYERLDITGLTGITDAQRTALQALGAVDQSTHPNSDSNR